mmetsp:Transcript_27427/g.76924  ORF Transcript_27427/g.76924 Transcript_27427/m.76924 type:complete len:171 (+) Transcript_27427:298-810(+)
MHMLVSILKCGLHAEVLDGANEWTSRGVGMAMFVATRVGTNLASLQLRGRPRRIAGLVTGAAAGAKTSFCGCSVAQGRHPVKPLRPGLRSRARAREVRRRSLPGTVPAVRLHEVAHSPPAAESKLVLESQRNVRDLREVAIVAVALAVQAPLMVGAISGDRHLHKVTPAG